MKISKKKFDQTQQITIYMSSPNGLKLMRFNRINSYIRMSIELRLYKHKRIDIRTIDIKL